MANIQPILINPNDEEENKMSNLADILAQQTAIEQQKPIQEQLSPEIILSNIMNGLNMENKNIADWQRMNNIPIPQTENEIEQARLGRFNTSLAPQTQQPQASATISKRISPFENFAMGFKDNLQNPIALKNFQAKSLSEKPISNRLGEGLGTVVRTLDNPLVRGLISGGIMALAGGSPTMALTTGLNTGATFNNNVTADRLYRNQLKQFGYTDDDLSKIRGFVTNDMYKNLSQNLWRNKKMTQDQAMKQLKLVSDMQKARQIDNETASLWASSILANADWSNADSVSFQDSNQTRNTDINEQLAPAREYALKTAPQVALGNLGLSQARFNEQMQNDQINNAYKELQMQEMFEKLKGTNLPDNVKKSLLENQQTIADIEAGLVAIQQNPNAYSLLKGALPAWATNRLDPQGVSTRTQIDNITALYRKWLTGAQMSDAERKSFERFLPAPTDDANTVFAKLQNMKASIERKNNVMLNGYNQLQPQFRQTVTTNNINANDPMNLGL